MTLELFSNDAPVIYLITEGALNADNFPEKSAELLETIEFTVRSKVDLIQIREKNLPAKFIYELAVKAAEIARNSETKILVNDRADIALAAGADGVHLTSNSLPAKVIRRKLPAKFIIGASVHSLAEAKIAAEQKADFITFSPVFNTLSKAVYGKPQGLEKLREVCEKLKPFPVIALGGINETNYSEVLKFGAKGFAAIRFLNDIEKLKKLAADLRR